jgi:hypothetical protein
MDKGKNQVHINLWNDWSSPYEKKLKQLFEPLGDMTLLNFDNDDEITKSRRILREREYDCAILHGGNIEEIRTRIIQYEIDYYLHWIAENSILFASQNAVHVLMKLGIVPTIKFLEHWNIYEQDPDRYDRRVHGYPKHMELPIEDYINSIEGELYLTCDYSYFVYQHGKIKAFGRMYRRKNNQWLKIDCRGRAGIIESPFTR